MFKIRKANDRGHFDFGWLKTFHTFSFGDYYDEANMGFASLRVINDDVVQPGEGFPTHGHKDMEIITYIIEGSLEHKDSMGNGSVIKPGDIQRMSAGRGVRHSEFNPSDEKPVHLLQVWILPAKIGAQSGYEQKFFEREEKIGKLLLVVSPDGQNGTVTVNQDAFVYAGIFDGLDKASHSIKAGRSVWLQVAKGSLTVNGHQLNAGDGFSAEKESQLELTNGKQAEVLLFDLK